MNLNQGKTNTGGKYRYIESSCINNSTISAKYEERNKFDIEEIDRVRQHLDQQRMIFQSQAEKNAEMDETKITTAFCRTKYGFCLSRGSSKVSMTHIDK
ncbi:unnamed protein product [Albugo candida]|uniref:Uncharacterized protein n=1 Tax=Albugo candida TaxID=65357 RepID=A0A024GRA5_9STRA|nr:unnamed protein product [Albugo candida]|eukprot:CCI49093.1 unnamed protein product [Albugo candida]